MTETTTQELSPETKDGLRKAANIIMDGFRFNDTPSGYKYWITVCIKLNELSGIVSSHKSTTGKVGKGEAKKEGPGYSGEIGSWKKFDTAAYYIDDMSWMYTSSGESYWTDVYYRVLSFAGLAVKGSKNDLAGEATKEPKEAMKEETLKMNQPGFKFDPMAPCLCGHAYHAHSKKRGCKFHAKDQCFKFVVKSISGIMAVKPPVAPKPEDFLEL